MLMWEKGERMGVKSDRRTNRFESVYKSFVFKQIEY
jgi:hypothetical protein